MIAQTLIERHAYGEGAKVIAAVLDFDAATIDPLDPATLFVALVDQLTPQIDGLRGQREIFDSIVAGGRDLARGGRMAIQRGAEDSRLLSEVAALSRELAQRSDQTAPGRRSRHGGARASQRRPARGGEDDRVGVEKVVAAHHRGVAGARRARGSR